MVASVESPHDSIEDAILGEALMSNRIAPIWRGSKSKLTQTSSLLLAYLIAMALADARESKI
jgi:hypothetical protein